MKGTDSFDILHISQSASYEEAKRAYKRLVKVWHPDQFADQPDKRIVAQEKLKEINIAYQEVTQIIEERNKQKNDKAFQPPKDLRQRNEKAPERPVSSWRTIISQFKKRLYEAKQFITEKNTIASHRQYKAKVSESTRRQNNAYEKNTSLNFEEVLQNSLKKRSTASKSYRKRKPISTRHKNTKSRFNTTYSKGYGMRRRSRHQAKGRIEAIRPVEKIKGVGRIK